MRNIPLRIWFFAMAFCQLIYGSCLLISDPQLLHHDGKLCISIILDVLWVIAQLPTLLIMEISYTRVCRIASRKQQAVYYVLSTSCTSIVFITSLVMMIIFRQEIITEQFFMLLSAIVGSTIVCMAVSVWLHRHQIHKSFLSFSKNYPDHDHSIPDMQQQ